MCLFEIISKVLLRPFVLVVRLNDTHWRKRIQKNKGNVGKLVLNSMNRNYIFCTQRSGNVVKRGKRFNKPGSNSSYGNLCEFNINDSWKWYESNFSVSLFPSSSLSLFFYLTPIINSIDKFCN